MLEVKSVQWVGVYWGVFGCLVQRQLHGCWCMVGRWLQVAGRCLLMYGCLGRAIDAQGTARGFLIHAVAYRSIDALARCQQSIVACQVRVRLALYKMFRIVLYFSVSSILHSFREMHSCVVDVNDRFRYTERTTDEVMALSSYDSRRFESARASSWVRITLKRYNISSGVRLDAAFLSSL